MDALTPTTRIHYYDTRQHVIACGLRGTEHRSTKHSRYVTCDACIALLGKHPEEEVSSASAPTGSAPS